MNILDAETARLFLFAGNAILTIKSQASGVHYTFRIRRTRHNDQSYFVALLIDEYEWAYMGMIGDDSRFHLTAKSRYNDGSTPVRAFRYFFGYLMEGSIAPRVEVRHEGKCGCCGRPLTHPDSIDRGIGPDCWEKVDKRRTS